MKFKAEDARRLRETVERLLNDHRLPGLSIGVVAGDELVFSEGFGFADIESGKPMTPEHRQRIGSITKTMVGLCAMALVEEGRLSLDARVVDLLPDVKLHGPAETLTVKHLLTHTGGIGEAPNPPDLIDITAHLFSEIPPTLPIAQAYEEGITIEVPPGSKWAYANHGYVLLGEILCRAEGKALADVLNDRIFGPLGMSDSDILDQPHPMLSTGYHRAPGEDELELLARVGREPPVEEPVDGINIRGKYLFISRGNRGGALSSGAPGAVQSTIPDMALYASALLRRGAGIVSESTFDRMVSPQWQLHPKLASWGLSFVLHPSYIGRRSFGHGGGVAGGWNTFMEIFPDEDCAVLIHGNISYEKFGEVCAKIVLAALGDAGQSAAAGPLDARALETAPAVYEAPTPGPLTNFRVVTGCGRVQLSRKNGELYLYARRGPWKHGVRLLPAEEGPDVLLLDTGGAQLPRVALVRDEDGNVSGLHFAENGLWSMVKNPEVEPWA
jgi:CubicO group peptidase (beta-lactamase class C family)